MGRPVGSKNSYRVVRQRGAGAANWKGGRRLSPAGYVLIFVGQAESMYRFEHDLVVERALGHRLPPGAVVHHADTVKANNRNDNLVACQDDAYHVELHRKLRVLRAGGNPWTDRMCCLCRKPKPATAFSKSRASRSGYGSFCAECGRERQRQRRAAAA